MFLLAVAAIFIALIGGSIYMTVSVARFQGIGKLAGERKWLKYLIAFLLHAAVFAAVSIVMSPVNAAVVFLCGVLFFLFFGAVMRIIRHVSGKEPRINWQGWLAIAASVIYLVTGYYLLHHVFRTEYSLQTEKPINLRIALFSDSHLSTVFDGDDFAAHAKTIEAQQPDIVMIAGDFVDDASKMADLQKACEALGSMDVKYGVWYVYGNHDAGYYSSRDFTAAELEQMLLDHGIHVLKDSCELVDDSFYVAGRLDESFGVRKPMQTLLQGIDTSKYIIVLDHRPNDFENEAGSAADLVLCGHTHGGQLFPVNYLGELVGSFDRTYGHENRNGTDFIVSSGIADWEVQFKTGTKSEYVIVDVHP